MKIENVPSHVLAFANEHAVSTLYSLGEHDIIAYRFYRDDNKLTKFNHVVASDWSLIAPNDVYTPEQIAAELSARLK